MPSLAPLASGLALSWSLAAPPGPANALMAQDAARRGFVAGFLTGLGACVGDLAMFLLMWLGVLRLVGDAPWLLVALAAVGAVLMSKFAYDAWRAARRPVAAAPSGRGSFARSFVTVTTSPFNWAWWLTAGTSLFAELGWLLMVGFFVGLVAWVVAWVGMARAGASRFRRFAELVSYAAAIVLAIFAAVVAWYAAREGFALLA